MMLLRLRTVVVAGGVLLGGGSLVGCSDESAAPEPTTLTTGDVIEETSTSTPTTQTTASTTETPAAEVEAAVEAAYLRSYEAYTSCLRSLPDCDPEVAFAVGYTGETYDRLVNSVGQSRDESVVYESPENPDHARTEVFDVTMGGDPNQAVVSFCTLAGDTKMLISPDGSRNRVGLNDTVLVEWGDAEMVLGDDGIWRIADYPADVGDVVEVSFDEIDRQLGEGMLCGGQILGN